MARPIRCSALSLLTGLGLLMVACGLNAEAQLTTDVGLLGGGSHELLVTVPEDLYHSGIFNQLPDFSLLTGVKVDDYHSAGQRGILVSQSFFRLDQLNNPASAHFLNRAFPGNPFSYRAHWRPGHLWRELEIEIFINSSQSNALAQGFTTGALSLLDAQYILHLPGDVINHNGAALDARTVEWNVDPVQPQTMSITANVISVPFILSLLFTLVAIGLAVGSHLVERSPTGPRSAISRPVGRPARIERPRRH